MARLVHVLAPHLVRKYIDLMRYLHEATDTELQARRQRETAAEAEDSEKNATGTYFKLIKR